MPCSTLPGKLAIHLMPETLVWPSIEAGRAMMRLRSFCGKRRK